MSDFNSVPPASAGMYGDDPNSSEQNNDGNNTSSASKQSNVSKQNDNSSAKSKGDKEHNGDSNNSDALGFESGKDSEDSLSSDVKKARKAGRIAKLAKSLLGGAGSIGNTVASAMAAKTTATAVAAVAAVVISVLVGIVAILGVLVGDIIPSVEEEAPVINVFVRMAATGNSNNADSLNVEASQREMARRIWSTMSAFEVQNAPDGSTYPTSGGPVQETYGLRGEQTLAMIGNFEHESGLDPTAVETIFTEPFQIGTLKQNAIKYDFVVSYWKAIEGTSSERNTYFTDHNTIYKAGIGLAQWTDTWDGTTWNIRSPGRNTKLQIYADIFGHQYYENENGSSVGWNGETWIKGSSETYSMWYDPSVQLAYILDKSDVGDSSATWVWNWANDSDGDASGGASTHNESDANQGDDFYKYDGDKHINIASLEADYEVPSEVADTTVEGWSDSSFNSDTGWQGSESDVAYQNSEGIDVHKYKITDDQITLSGTLNAMGSSTKSLNFTGVDTEETPNSTQDDYYNSTNATYVSEIIYEKWEATPEKGLSTSWSYTKEADGVTKTGEDAGRKLAAEYAKRCADGALHGRIDGVMDPTTTGANTAQSQYYDELGKDFLWENNPNLYDGQDYLNVNHYQKYLTAAEAKALDYYGTVPAGVEGTIVISDVKNLRTGWVWDSSAHEEHIHSSSCYTSVLSCSNSDPSHSHSSSCYSSVLSCGKHNHTHGTPTMDLTPGSVDGNNYANCSCDNGHKCKYNYTYKAGYVRVTYTSTHEGNSYTTTDPVAAANYYTKVQYLNCFKYYYRYHLQRYMTMYYTYQFQMEYEGCADDSFESRAKNSTKWYNMWWKAGNDGGTGTYGYPTKYAENASTMTPSGFDDKFFKVEEGYAQGIMQAIARTADELSTTQKDTKFYTYDSDMQNGKKIKSMNNTDIAKKALLIAWPDKSNSYGNDGTEVYKYIHDKVIVGDSIYQSCDRTACTAIRWSGVDDNFPAGNTLVQIEYLNSSPRWTEIDWGGDVNMLMPGDILIRKDSLAPSADDEDGGGAHHIVVYTGSPLAESAYINSDLALMDSKTGLNIVHGSFGERSPAMDTLYSNLRSYHVYRCTSPMAAGVSKYVSYSYIP